MSDAGYDLIAARGGLQVYADGSLVAAGESEDEPTMTVVTPSRDEWLWLMLVAAPAAIYALGPDGKDRRGADDGRTLAPEDRPVHMAGFVPEEVAPGGAGGTPPDAQVTIFEELADSGSS